MDKLEKDHPLTAWLAVLRAPSVGPATFIKLLQAFGTAEQIIRADTTSLKSLGLKEQAVQAIRSPDWDLIRCDLNWVKQPTNHIITLDSAQYPELLRQIPQPPPILFVAGNPELLHLPQIAIVGSRHPSQSGSRSAAAFAQALAQAGLVVTSGLAMGIDGSAHRGALASDCPTIAVVGNGLNIVYPASHTSLAAQIVERGAIISEFPPETQPKAKFFPRRNRIISGLSLGTLVVEAAQRSGSLITARQAAEQGREVFALPGSIHNATARGCHQLIKQGAKLVETAQDILEEIGALLTFVHHHHPVTRQRKDIHDFDDDYKILLENIGYEPTTIDTLVRRCRLTPESVSSMLLILELEGYVVSQSGGSYIRI